MRSSLARNVPRVTPRVLAVRNPLVPLNPIHQQPPQICSARIPSYLARRPARRTFFGVFRKPPREVKDPEFEPGYEVLLQFRASETEDVRPPPLEDITKGFVRFFNHKYKFRKPVNSTQAFCAVRVFLYLKQLIREDPGGFDLRSHNLMKVQEVLLIKPKGETEHHLTLTRLVYEELHRRRLKEAGGSEALGNEGKVPSLFHPLYPRDFHKYIMGLCLYGAASEASDKLLRYAQGRVLSSEDLQLWMRVLKAISEGGDEEALIQTARMMEGLKIPYGPIFQEIMVMFYARRADKDKLLTWFEREMRLPPTANTYSELLHYSTRQPQPDRVIDGIFSKLCQSRPPKELWNVILQWAVRSRKKGKQEIAELVAKLAEHDKGYPDITTINQLIEMAIEMKDPLLAERFLNWSTTLRLTPDMRTYALQADYRLDANDLTGAHDAFTRLMHRLDGDEDGAETEEYVTTIAHKYLESLCSRPDEVTNGRLSSVLALLEDREVRLEPETVASVCVAFLENDRQFELIDVLSLHTFQYSLQERAAVRDAIVEYCLSDSNSTARVWDAYSLLRQFFPETERSSRVRLMDAFFGKRRRPDMAVLVFGHMRAHSDPAIRPDLEVYCGALANLGRHPDPESLRLLHNMLKMDTTIHPDTRLYNALMMAYTGCGDPDTSLEFWREVANSDEGPSYNSLALVFWACEKLPYGDEKARPIWAKMQRMDIEVPPFVFAAYLGAIAGQGNLGEVKRLLMSMDASAGSHPEALT